MSVLMPDPEEQPTLEQSIAALRRLIPGEVNISTLRPALLTLKRQYPAAAWQVLTLYQEGGNAPWSGILSALEKEE